MQLRATVAFSAAFVLHRYGARHHRGQHAEGQRLGTIKVTASQAGNTSYLAATPVAQTITVSAFLAPTIGNEQATPNNSSTEILSANVNPNNSSTTWWFVWGLSPTTMTLTSSLTTGLTGTSPISLSAAAFNLQPGTTYYYRVVAKRVGGQTLGPTRTFTTPQSASGLLLFGSLLKKKPGIHLTAASNPG